MIDITNTRFGKYIAIENVGTNKHGVRLWKCRCDCGEIRIVQQGALRIGKSTSCGCSKKIVTHGRSRIGDPTYQSWSHMLDRCRNKNHVAYPRYGGRGITVSERWTTFENFLADMGERPINTTLDRIDTDKNYEAGNCRWATSKQQANNRRASRLIEHNGKSMTIAQWAAEIGISPNTLGERLRRGWSIEKALRNHSDLPST